MDHLIIETINKVKKYMDITYVGGVGGGDEILQVGKSL